MNSVKVKGPIPRFAMQAETAPSLLYDYYNPDAYEAQPMVVGQQTMFWASLSELPLSDSPSKEGHEITLVSQTARCHGIVEAFNAAFRGMWTTDGAYRDRGDHGTGHANGYRCILLTMLLAISMTKGLKYRIIHDP